MPTRFPDMSSRTRPDRAFRGALRERGHPVREDGAVRRRIAGGPPPITESPATSRRDRGPCATERSLAGTKRAVAGFPATGTPVPGERGAETMRCC